MHTCELVYPAEESIVPVAMLRGAVRMVQYNECSAVAGRW